MAETMAALEGWEVGIAFRDPLRRYFRKRKDKILPLVS